MGIYRFRRFGTLWRDDHPLALYAGNRRLSPPEVLVWWWPINWVAFAIALPFAIYDVISKRRKGGTE